MVDVSNYIKVKITKVGQYDLGKYSEIKVNSVYEGYINKQVEVGDYVYLYKAKEYSLETILRTTKVSKIESSLFYTRNSVYEIITKEEERKRKIESIFDSP